MSKKGNKRNIKELKEKKRKKEFWKKYCMSGMTAEQYCSQIRNRALNNTSDKIIKNLKVESICETTKRFINKELEDEQLMLFSVGIDLDVKDLKIIASTLCFNLLNKLINTTIDKNNRIVNRVWISEE